MAGTGIGPWPQCTALEGRRKREDGERVLQKDFLEMTSLECRLFPAQLVSTRGLQELLEEEKPQQRQARAPPPLPSRGKAEGQRR